MSRIGRPSAIFEMIREARCDQCGVWLRTPLLRFHREGQHPLVPEQTGGELREIPLPLRIAEYVEAGNYLQDAAAACGVDRTTVNRWMALGGAIAEELGPEASPLEVPAERRIFFVFYVMVTHARDAARVHRRRIIEQSDDWKAHAWLLERTSPAEYGRVDRLRVGGDADASPIRVIQEQADPDFVAEVMRIYEEQGVLPGVDSASHNGKARATARRRQEE